MKSFSIKTFCDRHEFGRTFFYKLEKQGKAPRTIRVGSCRRITEEDEIAWIEARKAETAKVAA